MIPFQPGIRSNLKQFTLLVVVNAFVGAMIGIERSIFPRFAEDSFGITSLTAMLSFIAAFGMSKAITNYFTGKWANRYGRKKLLVVGWFIALSVPVILLLAHSWAIVVFANVLLGISQGMTWSAAVIMKVDLSNEHERGLAMGLNEFAGYLFIGLAAYLSAYLTDTFGTTDFSFIMGIGFAAVGIFISLLFIRETNSFVLSKKQISESKTSSVFLDTTWRNKTLSSVTQAGLVNNLNDGMLWGLLPVLLASQGYNLSEIGMLAGIYPAVWGIMQLPAGKIADLVNRKNILFLGMILQACVILRLSFSLSTTAFVSLSVLLGIGTAMVYPTFLAIIADETSVENRAEALGVFRFWRDMGYVFGALLSGLIADLYGLNMAILLVGGLTFFSGMIIKFRMP
jgi:MFS family permease